LPPTPIQPQKPSIFPGKPRYRGFHRIYVYTTNLQSGSSPKIVRVRILAVSICDYRSRVCFGYQGYLYELSSYRPSVFPFLLPPFPPHHTPNSPLTPYQIQIQNQSRLHRCPRFRRIHRFENSSLISCAALEAARGYVSRPLFSAKYLTVVHISR